MLRIVRHLALSIALLICSAPAALCAQEGQSPEQLAAGNELLEAGKAAYTEGHLSEALSDFEQAFARTRRPSILYRIADTADKLGEHERAIDAFEDYLAAFPNSKDREFITQRIAANRAALATPAAQAALSPEAAAQAAPPSAEAASPLAPAPAAASKPLLKQWWLWAGAGVIVVAGVVVTALLVGSSSTHKSGPINGNVGGVVETLRTP
jgi:tetratricopeptide (TPR) repeat protein